MILIRFAKLLIGLVRIFIKNVNILIGFAKIFIIC